MYLKLLFLCGILSQGFIGTFADEDSRESSDIHVRQKRVVNRLPGEDRPISITSVRYVVMIKYNNRISCTGSILSHHVVITATRCVRSEPQYYHVVANTARTSRGNIHRILEIKNKNSSLPNRPLDGISLLTVTPAIGFGTYARAIQLHTGPLLLNTVGTVSGWGFNCRGAEPGTKYVRDLRSIEVPIMPHQECVTRYQPYIQITEKDICTFHPQKNCGHNDYGAGLIVDGYLAGVFLHGGPLQGNTDFMDYRYPDVFAMVQHSEYKQWIITNVENTDIQFLNQHQ